MINVEEVRDSDTMYCNELLAECRKAHHANGEELDKKRAAKTAPYDAKPLNDLAHKNSKTCLHGTVFQGEFQEWIWHYN